MSILKSESEAFYRVKGAWLIRGRSIQPMLDENPDASSYKWIQIEEDKEEDKKELADLWCVARPSMEWRLTPTSAQVSKDSFFDYGMFVK